MWIVFSLIAMVTAFLNVIATMQKKDAKWFCFISLSCTALTVCAFYNADANWVANEDWAALMDVTVAMNNVLWICTIASILINSIALFKK